MRVPDFAHYCPYLVFLYFIFTNQVDIKLYLSVVVIQISLVVNESKYILKKDVFTDIREKGKERE